MTVELAAAVVAGVAALASAVGTIWSSIRNSERANANTKSIEQLKIQNEETKDAHHRQQEISKLSEPLARSAYDLQSRLYNMMNKDLVDAYLVHGDTRQKSYFINNTTFLVGQYLCWTELVRREIQFIELGEDLKTRELQRLQDTIYSLWGSDKLGPLFRIFAGEQRAIGEALIRESERRPECMGYGAFLKTFDKGVDPLIDTIRRDVESLDNGLYEASERLINIQHALIDLLTMLDPQHLRFPADRRSKVSKIGCSGYV